MLSFRGRHHKQGNTVYFLLTAKRDTIKAACRFLDKAIGSEGKPSLTIIDKGGGNTAAIEQYSDYENKHVKVRQFKYLNNIVEQGHRIIKRKIWPMLGFKSFRYAYALLLWLVLNCGLR